MLVNLLGANRDSWFDNLLALETVASRHIFFFDPYYAVSAQAAQLSMSMSLRNLFKDLFVIYFDYSVNIFIVSGFILNPNARAIRKQTFETNQCHENRTRPPAHQANRFSVTLSGPSDISGWGYDFLPRAIK